ncbi:MAG: nucleoside-triphosphatase, partial [Clostridiales bacterium]|nr:nucleoside-triphosphatase [Clostridiales bacterium]
MITTRHIFLTGPKRIGKSTAIRAALAILGKDSPLAMAGFLTYWGGDHEQCLYMADASQDATPSLLAIRRDAGMEVFSQAFEEQGVR